MFATLALFATCSFQGTPMSFSPTDKVIRTESGLEFVDSILGTGEEVVSGATPVVNYLLNLEDGSEVDSSKKIGRLPFRFTVGKSEVIKGWEQGLLGMKIGGTRKLRIPFELAYGEKGRPPVIPEKATLWFSIELLEIWYPATFLEKEKVEKRESGIEFTELFAGKGESAKTDDKVEVHYWLYNNEIKLIDTSANPGRDLLKFEVGSSKLIPGFSEGVKGMKMGGKRKIKVPPALGYGANGSGAIKPNETLWFTIELVKLTKK